MGAKLTSLIINPSLACEGVFSNLTTLKAKFKSAKENCKYIINEMEL